LIESECQQLCKRLKGGHEYDKIASEIQSVYDQYDVEKQGLK